MNGISSNFNVGKWKTISSTNAPDIGQRFNFILPYQSKGLLFWNSQSPKLYNNKTDKWSNLKKSTAMLFIETSLGYSCEFGERIFVLSQNDERKIVGFYRPITGEWTSIPIPSGIEIQSVRKVITNKRYIFIISNDSLLVDPKNYIALYDPKNNTWDQINPDGYQIPYMHFVVNKNTLFGFGGGRKKSQDGDLEYSNKMIYFDFKQKQWYTMFDPKNTNDASAPSIQKGNNVHLVDHHIFVFYSNDFYQNAPYLLSSAFFDSRNKKWHTLQDIELKDNHKTQVYDFSSVWTGKYFLFWGSVSTDWHRKDKTMMGFIYHTKLKHWYKMSTLNSNISGKSYWVNEELVVLKEGNTYMGGAKYSFK